MAQLKLTWFSDLKAESDMRQMSIAFDVASVPFSKIDLKESQVNGARIAHPLVRDLIDDYKQGMRNGDTFPRVVLSPWKAGYLILSGNQRCTAISELIAEGELPKSLSIEAYVTDDLDSLVREGFARAANVSHGGRSVKEERLAHAIYCVKSLGMAVNNAAKLFMVANTTINSHIRAEKERTALQHAGIDASRIPVTALASLSQLSFDDRAKEQIGYLAAQHDMPAERVSQLVKAVKKEKSAPARIATIKKVEKELAAQSRATAQPSKNGHGKTPQRPRRDKVLGMMDRLVDFLEQGNDGSAFTTLEQLQFSGETDTYRAKSLAAKLSLRFKVLGL